MATGKKISNQILNKVKRGRTPKRGDKKKLNGTVSSVISTGSTLLDLAISGGRAHGGGIPGGILVEIFGPSGSGKTVLLCEIAGAVKRGGGAVMFRDPEARLNKQFARLFDLDVDEIAYDTPHTVPEVFKPIREWVPKNTNLINGIFADSMAALTTEMELDEKDQYGMRRAKEFSEQLRLTCRTLTNNNFLMVVSNQIRENIDAGAYGQKYRTPGGKGLEFYSSLRLRMKGTEKIKRKVKVKGREFSRVVGVTTEVEVSKSSVWAPYHTAPVTILFDYGIDDIRQNLQFVKQQTGAKVYTLDGEALSNSMDQAIAIVEEDNLENDLREEVIELWQLLEEKFNIKRKPKKRNEKR